LVVDKRHGDLMQDIKNTLVPPTPAEAEELFVNLRRDSSALKYWKITIPKEFMGEVTELEGIVVGVRKKMLGQPDSHIVLHQQGELWYRKTYALEYTNFLAGTGTSKGSRKGFKLVYFIPPLARPKDIDTLGLSSRDKAKVSHATHGTR
jgi:hypothetical protein